MKNIIIIIFSLIISFSIYSEAQIVQDNETIMSNLVLLNKKISDLSSKVNGLKTKISSLSKKNDEFRKEAKDSILILDERIDDLFFEFSKINVDYKATLIQIEQFRDENLKQEEEITKILNDFKSLYEDLLKIGFVITNLDMKFKNLPDIYTNPDARPQFAVNASLIKFFTFGLSDLNVEPGFSLGASYRLDKKFSLWADFTSPFVLSLSSSIPPEKGNISDKWNAQLISFGGSYINQIKDNSNLNLLLSGGLFYGAVTYDKFANSTVNLDRDNAEGINTYGANIRLGISYNQFNLKNPLELYFICNNLISSRNIVLKTDQFNRFDLGAYLFSVSLGINFCFW
jgi:outer membrane murein-binding lipoprotein Lpp